MKISIQIREIDDYDDDDGKNVKNGDDHDVMKEMMKVMEREKERETETRRRERKKREERERERKTNSRSCADHSRDHNRLLVPRSKQALSRRLQVQHPTKNLPNSWTLWSMVQDRSNETQKKKKKKKTRARELVIAGGARNGRLWRARTPGICG